MIQKTRELQISNIIHDSIVIYKTQGFVLLISEDQDMNLVNPNTPGFYYKGHIKDWVDERNSTTKSRKGSFAAIFVVNIHRELSDKEISQLIQLLNPEGILFHIDEVYVDWQKYAPFLFTQQRFNREIREDKPFCWTTLCFKNPGKAELYDLFFEQKEWQAKVKCVMMMHEKR